MPAVQTIRKRLHISSLQAQFSLLQMHSKQLDQSLYVLCFLDQRSNENLQSMIP